MSWRVRVLAAFVLCGVGSPTLPSVASAACVTSGGLSPEAVAQFQGAPSKLLSQPGAELIRQTRDLAVSSRQSIDSIVGLIGSASPEQRAGIGTGLGQAATICASRDIATAESLQRAILAIASPEVVAAFRAATGDARTTAVGGAGGAGGGALGGSGLASLGGALSGGSGFGPTTTSLTPNSGFGFSSTGGRSVNITRRATMSVSP